MPNKANWPLVDRKRHRLRGPQGLPSLGTSAPNKANSSRATRRASALWKRRYDELDLQGPSAKQSQFRDGRACARADKAAGSAGGTGCANKANSPHGRQWPRAGMAASAGGGVHRAKQSQFAPRRPEEASAPGAARAAAAGGDKRAKQSQSPGSGRRDGSGTCHCGRSVAIRPRTPATPGRGDRYNSLAVSRGCR